MPVHVGVALLAAEAEGVDPFDWEYDREGPRDPAYSALETDVSIRAELRRGGQDGEVEQDPVGEADPGLVVPPALPGALLAFPSGGGESVEVGGGQLAEAAAGLDQSGPPLPPWRTRRARPPRPCPGHSQEAAAGTRTRSSHRDKPVEAARPIIMMRRRKPSSRNQLMRA